MYKVGAINRRDRAAFPEPFALRKGSEPNDAAFGTVIASYARIGNLLKDGFVIVVPTGRCGLLACPKRRDKHESESSGGGYDV
jgi:hypothetical protein